MSTIRRFHGFHGTKALLVQAGVLVGVLRTARTREGKSLVDIAALNDYGSRSIVVQLSPKGAHVPPTRPGRPNYGQPGARIAVIQIPVRPFLAPVFDSTLNGTRSHDASSSESRRS